MTGRNEWRKSGYSASVLDAACVEAGKRTLWPNGVVTLGWGGDPPATVALEKWLNKVLPPSEDTLQDCVMRLEVLRRALYDKENGTFDDRKGGATRDDSTLQSGRPENMLASTVGGTWRPEEPKLSYTIEQLRKLGNRSAAFVLDSPPFRERHARLLLNVDGDVFWIETLAPPWRRVKTANDKWLEPTGGARVIIVDPDGRADPLPGRVASPASTVEAVLDRSRGIYYKGGGREDETRIIAHFHGISQPGEDVQLFYDPDTGIELMTDGHEVVVSPDGNYVSLDTAATLGLGGDDFVNVKIIEVKNRIPMQSGPDEAEHSNRVEKRNGLRALRETHDKLNSLTIRHPGPLGPNSHGSRLVDLFPPNGRRWYHPVYRDYVYLVPGPEDVDKMYSQFSFGVRPGGLSDVMRFAYKKIWTADTFLFKEHLSDGIQFGEEISKHYITARIGAKVGDFYSAAMEHVSTVAIIRGTVGASYTQVAAAANSMVRPDSLTKAHTAINLRTALFAVADSLDDDARNFLSKSRSFILSRFKQYIEHRLGGNLVQLLQGAGYQIRPDADVIAGTFITGGRDCRYTLADYWDNLILPDPRISLNQDQTLGVLKNFTELDAGKVVLEFRQHGKELQTAAEAEKYYLELDAVVQEADEKARRVKANGKGYENPLIGAIRRLNTRRPYANDAHAATRHDLASRIKILAESTYANYPAAAHRSIIKGHGISNVAAELVLALDRFNASANQAARDRLYSALKTLSQELVSRYGPSAETQNADQLLLELKMLSMNVSGAPTASQPPAVGYAPGAHIGNFQRYTVPTMSYARSGQASSARHQTVTERTGGQGRAGAPSRGPAQPQGAASGHPARGGGSHARWSLPRGGAESVDPISSRLPLGERVVIDSVSMDSSLYGVRHGPRGMLAVREVQAIPDTHSTLAEVAGGAASTQTSRGKGRATQTFTRWFGTGRSSLLWFSYTVSDTDEGIGVLLPDGVWLPGEGWYRHGPLFLHRPLEPAGPGWVLFGDTGWIGRIDNTDTLFSVADDRTGLDGDILIDGFDPATAPPYQIQPEPSGLFLSPTGEQGSTVQLAWQDMIQPEAKISSDGWLSSSLSKDNCVEVIPIRR